MKTVKHQSKPSSSSSASARKSRWESDSSSKDRPAKRRSPLDPKPSSKDEPPTSRPSSAAAAAADIAGGGAGGGASPFAAHPDIAFPPPHPPYGFHNLDRRTIVLADGSVRSYFALPPDYPLEPQAPFSRPAHGPEIPFDKRFPPPPHPSNAGRFSPNDFREPPPPFRRDDYWASLGLDGPRASEAGPSSMKRKYGEEDEFARHRQSVLQYGNSNPNGFPSGSGGDRGDFTRRGGSPHRRDYHDDSRMAKQGRFEGEGYDGVPPRRGRREEDFLAVAVDVDPKALKRAFLKFAKIINENLSQRKNYLEDGKSAPLQCIVCGRASKDFADVHELVLHAYSSQNAELRVDHLGLHKALCVFMGWNYAKAPDYSKAYQSLSADEVAANREDLIVWPPTVIIHNTNSGRRKDGRMEGMGNKEMDTKLKDLGFGGGKSKSLYGKEGHLGMTLVKFASTQAGLKEAERLSEYFEKDNHGRKGWSRAQAMSSSLDDDKNPALVKLEEKTGEKKRILYGYLLTASDLDKVDPDTRKRLVIKSRKEPDSSD